MADKDNFQRGDIFWIFLPRADLSQPHSPPPPDYLLHDRHQCICLTSSDDVKVPQNQVLIVPISKATADVKSGRLYSTHVELDKEIFTFLNHKSYVLLHKPRPVNRKWLVDYVGNMNDYDDGIMKKIGIATLNATGNLQDALDLARSLFVQQGLIREE